MRRFVIVFLLMILPVQWSWAAAANLCAHEADPSQAQHLGHHQHTHAAQAESPADADQASGGQAGKADTKTSFDTDCHGHGVVGMVDLKPLGPTFWPGAESFGHYVCQIPERTPGPLLRPPAARLA